MENEKNKKNQLFRNANDLLFIIGHDWPAGCVDILKGSSIFIYLLSSRGCQLKIRTKNGRRQEQRMLILNEIAIETFRSVRTKFFRSE